MSSWRILALGGDGIGPEVLAGGIALLQSIASRYDVELAIEEDLLHGACFDVHGVFCRDETVAAAKDADAILVGAVGGPLWDDIKMPGGIEEQDGLMCLRSDLDTFAGLRPARSIACLEDLSPYRPNVARGVDILILREMCGGTFFSEPRVVECNFPNERRGIDTTAYIDVEIEQIARVGFDLARRRRGYLCSVDKSNVMCSGELWREVVNEVGKDYPEVALEHLYADTFSYQLAINPKRFDVVLADNLFGDILSDQAGAIVGSLGLLPSACLCARPMEGVRTRGIFEPVHGSAPDIAGKGIANPVGMLLSVAMMLEYAFCRSDLAQLVEQAVETALATGVRTPDLGGSATTEQLTEAVVNALDG